MQPVSPSTLDERHGREEVSEEHGGDLCFCELCGVELGEEDLAEEGEIGKEEGQPAKGLVQPKAPSRKAVDEHELTHCPYRSWCIHCRKARGQAMGHYSKEEMEEEERDQVSTTWAFDYTFLTEDFELLTKDEANQPIYRDKLKDVVMVSDDRSSGGVKAHLVNCKGLQDGWIDGRLAEDIADFGYRGADI